MLVLDPPTFEVGPIDSLPSVCLSVQSMTLLNVKKSPPLRRWMDFFAMGLFSVLNIVSRAAYQTNQYFCGHY